MMQKWAAGHVRVVDYADGVVPPRHRTEAQLQKWLDHVEARFESPPVVVIHLHPKGEQDNHYAKMRPKVAPEAKHLYTKSRAACAGLDRRD